MSSRTESKPVTTSKEAAKPGHADSNGSGTPASRRPAAPTPMPVAPAGDLIRLDEESDIVDVDSRPAGEAQAGHRTYAGYPLPPNASEITPPNTAPEPPARRPLPTPKPREAPIDLSIDERTDLLTDVPSNSSSSAATQAPSARRQTGNGGSPSPRIPRIITPGQAPPAGSFTTFKIKPAPLPAPPPPAVPSRDKPKSAEPDTAVRDADPIDTLPPLPPDHDDAQPVAFDTRPSNAVNTASPQARELDSYASLSLNSNDAATESSFQTGEKPTGLLTSGVATPTADIVPDSHITEPAEYPSVAEPPAEIEPAESTEPPEVSEVQPATHAEAVFDPESADPPLTGPESQPIIDPPQLEPAAAIAPASPATTTPSVPQPPVIFVIGSIVSLLLGAFTFGVPSFGVAAAALASLRRRKTGRVAVFFAFILALIAGVIGVAVSMAWYFNKSHVHVKAW